MKKERFVEDAEPCKLYCEHDSNTIYVGDGLPDVPKNSFCYSSFFFHTFSPSAYNVKKTVIKKFVIKRRIIMNDTSTGKLFVKVYTGEETTPVKGAGVIISKENETGGEDLISYMTTNSDGKTGEISLPTPLKSVSLTPQNIQGYSTYNIRVDKPGFYSEELLNVPIFSQNTTIQPVSLVPLPLDSYSGKKKVYISEPYFKNGEEQDI